ncbi:UNVERIFIED_CONTAM: hypothetical protein FKN15_045600 [Acipenser sinensis]
MLKGDGSVSREVRVGVTQAYVVFVTTLGGQWLERNFATFLSHVLDLVSHPRAIQTHVEAVYSRRCVSFLLRATLGSLLGEKAQIAATKEICQAISKQMRAVEAVVNDANSENKAGAADISASQHVMVCALKELGSLVRSLSATASPLIQEPSIAIRSFVAHCPELLTEDVIRRLMTPIECAMTMMSHIPSVIKAHGAHLKASAAMVRLRLYDILALLPPKTYEGSFNALLRELVAEFTLTDNSANTTTSLLRSLCHYDDSVLLGSWLQETDHKSIEDQLQLNSASGSGALEHDPSSIYLHVPVGEAIPGPLPLGVSVIDASVALFGVVFPHVSFKHRLKSARDVVSRTGHSLALGCLHRYVGGIGSGQHLKTSVSILLALAQDGTSHEVQLQANSASGSGALEHDPSSIYLHVPVGEAIPGPLPLGVSVIDASVALFGVVFPHVSFKHRLQMLDHFAECIKQAKGVRQQAVQLNIFTAVLSALKGLAENKSSLGPEEVRKSALALVMGALDNPNPILRCAAGEALGRMAQVTWALHSLALIVDSSGPMYRGYVEPTLSLVLTLLLTVPPSHTEVHQCLGRCLGALITTVGPELQGHSATISTIRSSCLVGCAIMQDHSDSLVQAAAISCLQQLHMFAPRHVNLSSLVPCLCVHLCSSHLLLRRAAVACLRQLAQREAAEVCEYAMSLAKKADDPKDSTGIKAGAAVPLQVGKEEDLEKKDEMDDDIMFTALGEDDKSMPSVAPRWVTRVFAADCLCRIILLCENADKVHFDLAAARSAKLKNPKDDLLVLHFSDLICMAFMAATDHSNQLRMAGLQALEDIIKKFAAIPEPEFPGHVILEQYQANVGTALRPAFSQDTPSDITAKACQVCSTWIGSGVVSDLNDLRRVHNLLVSSLDKVQSGKGSSSQLYSESATTMEKLAVLKAWAEYFEKFREIIHFYWVAMKIKKEAETKPQKAVKSNEEEEDDFGAADMLSHDSLITLVQPKLPTLNHLWLAALKDYTLLTLPAEFASQLPSDGGAFYTPETIDTARLHYRNSWAPILHAVAIWLNSTGFSLSDLSEDMATNLQRGLTAAGSSQPSSMAMKIKKEAETKPQKAVKSNEEEEDDFGAADMLSHDSLITLVQPKLPTLNHLWLAALKDYTLLTLPAEFASQLPSDGGAFYTPETIDTARLHYRNSWAPILHAVAIWLNSTGFSLSDLSEDMATNLQRAAWSGTPECASPSAPYPRPSLCAASGGAFYTPETIDTARLHYRNSWAPILHAVAIWLNSTGFSLSDLSEDMATNLQRGKEDAECLLGEGGDTGCLVPGKSLVFAAMELLVFVLVRHLPQLNSKVMDSPSHMPYKPQQLPEESARLVAATVTILANLPSLCSPDGNVQAKCYQLLLSVFQHSNRALSTPYIHSLAALMVEKLKAVERCKPSSNTELLAVQEGIKVLETLVAMGEEQNRVQLLSLLVPTLISYLLDENAFTSAPTASMGLHEFALQDLMRIGPLYPSAFKTVIGAAPELKSWLETAIRASQASSKAKAAARLAQPTVQAAPTIKLKTSFF